MDERLCANFICFGMYKISTERSQDKKGSVLQDGGRTTEPDEKSMD